MEDLPTSITLTPPCKSPGSYTVRKNTPGFPGFCPPGRESKFGGCLPVIHYSALYYCSLYYSRPHESQTRKPGLWFLTLVFMNGTVFGFSQNMKLPRAPQKNGQFEFGISLSCIRTFDIYLVLKFYQKKNQNSKINVRTGVFYDGVSLKTLPRVCKRDIKAWTWCIRSMDLVEK